MFNFNKPKVIVDEKEIEKVLSRGVEAIFPNKDFLKSKMMKGERFTLYLGVDPTGPTLHLGHAITIKKLGEFQRLGHQIIFLIGDFTAMIGDPTDKTATRKKLTHKQVLENCKEYQKQASKFISFSGSNKAQLKYNSQWLSKMNFENVLELASYITYAQIIKRDMFQERIAQDKDLFLHEFMYPMMQGYDSVAMDVNVEIGGNDQTFNMLVGRDLMKKMKNKEKFVLTTKLLTDSSGKKMGKTEGNMVSLDQTPEEMFGKIMSWSDDLIIPGFEIITNIPIEEIVSIKNAINSGANPKDYKTRLAKEIISMLFDENTAQKSEESFIKVFTKGEIPEDIIEIEMPHGSSIKDSLVKNNIVSSNSDWRRLVEGRAVSHIGTDELIEDIYIKAEKDITLRIGKKRFIKIIVK
ncbi:MAG: tyrosine--tRNA ligase [Patescibacteria group bacterium]